MKKLMGLFLVVCSTTFAAFQYEIITYPYNNVYNEGYGGNYFAVNIIEGTGSVYIVDKINNLSSMPGNNEILSRVMSNYGYIDTQNNLLVEGTWETKIVNQYQKNQWNGTVYQTAYKLGTFTEGDSIGVWIANKQGVINASLQPWYSAYGSYGLEKKPDAFGTILAELDYIGSSPIFFGFHGHEESFSGQPLPGFFASFFVGTMVLGVCSKGGKKWNSRK